MKTEILLAIDDKNWELEMGRAISESALIKIARRCVDLSEVLTMIEVGTYQAVIISSELSGLDLEAISKIKNSGTLVIGVFNESEFEKADYMSALGFNSILSYSINNAEVYLNNLIFLLNQNLQGEEDPNNNSKIPGLIVVWGTDGAPGRSSLAIDLASYLNKKFKSCLLIDADAQAPSLGMSLGISEEISGLSAALHLAQKGKLTDESFSDCLDLNRERISVLTGILRANRWIELRGSSFERVLEFASKKFLFQVVDTNATLPDEMDTNYPEFDSTHRFGHLVTLFKKAEKIIFVVKATPLGIIRAAEVLGNQNFIDTRQFTVIVNQIDELYFKRDATNLIYNVLERFVPKNQIWFNKSHPQAYAQAWLEGSSGHSLVKGQVDLNIFFEQFTRDRDLHIKQSMVRKSKFVA